MITIFNASIVVSPGGHTIIRGLFDSCCLDELLTDTYQREVMTGRPQLELIKAFEEGVVFPDLDLGCRSSTFVEEGSDVLIDGDVYIVDGLQRVAAARAARDSDNVKAPHVGVMVHMGSTHAAELQRFAALNVNRRRVSANVLLKNSAELHPCVGRLSQLSRTMPEFRLYQRVTWSQKPGETHVVTANTLFRVALRVHAHLMPGLRVTNSSESSLVAGDRLILEHVGSEGYKANVLYYFDLIEECWGISDVKFVNKANWLKAGFLVTLAAVISDHADFWRDNGHEMFLNKDQRRKLGSFKMSDPTLAQMCSTSSVSDVLYAMLVNHFNSGKRSGHLRPRNGAVAMPVQDVEEKTPDQA
jgi:hypothetical protein